MNWETLLSSDNPIPLHAIVAIAATFLGAAQLALPKGTAVHKAFGYTWVALMLVVSVSGFFIQEINIFFGFSPIHLISIWTIIAVYFALYHAKKRNIKKHKRWMISLYFFALVLAGVFTLLPGRVMHGVFFA